MKYALWLYSLPGITSVKIRLLREQGLSARDLYTCPVSAMRQTKGITERDIEAILEGRKHSPEAELAGLLEKGIGFVSLEQEAYPAKLAGIGNPPFGLYYRGRLPENKYTVAIVGARGRSEYGRIAARQLAGALTERGIPVISGLARGIDADAHLGALEGGGRTYAVMGCGVDICYPRSNRYLYDRILEKGGGILSEYPPGQQPMARLFPSRNRIISGLSDCVAVIEARERSGSLITADFALEQGRDVYALPGRITDALSAGCNRLIRQGAGIITGAEDFLGELHRVGEEFHVQIDFLKILLEKDEQLVYSLLDFSPTGLGTLLERLDLSLEELLDILGRLEAKKYIRESVPNYYVRCM